MPFPDLDPNWVFRDYQTDGVPAAGRHEPVKWQIRRLLKAHENAIVALIGGQGGDIDLARGVIHFTITGGDENAIIAEPDAELPDSPGSAIFIIGGIAHANTGPVTINGKPLLTSTGNHLPAGAILPNAALLFLDNGGDFRLLSDASMQAINEALRDQAVVARNEAVAARDMAVPAAEAALDARDVAVNAASGAGDVDAAFDSYGEAEDALGDLSNGDRVVVWVDEEHDDTTTRYVVEDGDLVFKVRYADMLSPVYDPDGKITNAFDSANHDYDNSESGLDAETVQDAVDELAGRTFMAPKEIF